MRFLPGVNARGSSQEFAELEPASIDFYEALGARPRDEWTVYRLTDGALRELGSGD
jgi:hypothetical protein